MNWMWGSRVSVGRRRADSEGPVATHTRVLLPAPSSSQPEERSELDVGELSASQLPLCWSHHLSLF